MYDEEIKYFLANGFKVIAMPITPQPNGALPPAITYRSQCDCPCHGKIPMMHIQPCCYPDEDIALQQMHPSVDGYKEMAKAMAKILPPRKKVPLWKRLVKAYGIIFKGEL